MRPGEGPLTIASIIARFPVVWCEESGPTYAGSLVLGPSSLILDGAVGGARSIVELPYDELEHVRMARRPDARLRGGPTLHVDAAGRRLRIAVVSEAGAMSEVADALTRAIPLA
jgi:hypothetical protein